MNLNDEKVLAVQGFMAEAFPGAEVLVEQDVDAGGRIFKVRVDNLLYMAVVTHDFLDHHRAAEIPEKLRAFMLLEHLKDMPGTPFLVTREGLQLRYS